MYGKKGEKSIYYDKSKYGTSFIPEFNGVLLKSDNVKKMNEVEKTEVADYLFKLYRAKGFPHTILTQDELLHDFILVQNTKVDSIKKDEKTLTTYYQAGLNLVKHFSPHFYEVNSGIRSNHMSMIDTFNNDDLLKKVIQNRLHDNFNMTGNMLKQGLANSKLAYKASLFNVIVGKYIYSQYTKENDVIYDYSMGFGQRLIGAMSLSYPVTYIGIDPWKKSVDSNQNIFNFLQQNTTGFNKKAEIIHQGSETYCDPKYLGKVNLAFSSAPYFNLEKYEDANSQAYTSGYINFIHGWWKSTVKNIKNLLIDNGILALNIKDKVEDFNLMEDMCNIIKEYGFELIHTYQMQLSRNTSFRNKDKNVENWKYEPIFIFRKNIIK